MLILSFSSTNLVFASPIKKSMSLDFNLLPFSNSLSAPSKSNKKYFNKLGVKKIYSYLAPMYDIEKLTDKKLLSKINKVKPNFIITNIGGGTQEILGLYLITNLKFKTTILCTGGAISYFTGEQAPIVNLIDKLYLGWLTRIIFYPIIFLKRYLLAFRLLPIVLKSKVEVKYR